MQTTETEFIEIAKRLIDTYQRKVQRLKSIVSDFEAEPKQPDLPLTIRNGDFIVAQATPIQQEKPAERIMGAKPKNAAQWIRWGIGQMQERVLAPELLKTIHAAGPQLLLKTKITSARISTALYQLVKDGELEPVSKTPGKASIYHVTSKFVTFEQLKKEKKKRKPIEAEQF